MVTRGGLAPARFAIECYQQQTYANRELVIVSDTVSDALAAHIDRLGDASIRIITTPPAPLGTLRNISVKAAHGPIIAQWDDDDLYHP